MLTQNQIREYLDTLPKEELVTTLTNVLYDPYAQLDIIIAAEAYHNVSTVGTTQHIDS